MRFVIFTSEPVKEPHIASLEENYLNRMKSWIPISLESQTGSRSPSFRSRRSSSGKGSSSGHPAGRRTFLPPALQRGFLILLDETGRSLNSRQFATLLVQATHRSECDTVFAIGPATGWTPTQREEADMLLSLSPMTFPHQIVRLLLLEQIYRGLAINRGLPYHKD